MGRDTAYWYRRAPGVLVGDGRVSFRDVSVESKRVDDLKHERRRAKAICVWKQGVRPLGHVGYLLL